MYLACNINQEGTMKKVLNISGKEYVCPKIDIERFPTQNVLETSSAVGQCVGDENYDVTNDTISYKS